METDWTLLLGPFGALVLSIGANIALWKSWGAERLAGTKQLTSMLTAVQAMTTAMESLRREVERD